MINDKLVYLLCTRNDVNTVKDVYKKLRLDGWRVETPLFRGSAKQLRDYETNLMARCAGVVLFYGQGSKEWRYSKESLLRKTAGMYRGGALPKYSIVLANPANEDQDKLAESEHRYRPLVVDLRNYLEHVVPEKESQRSENKEQVRLALPEELNIVLHEWRPVGLKKPYPGLRPYLPRENFTPGEEEPGEEHLFFGRDRLVDNIITKMTDNRFMAILGTSGSGKSSLVKCGLVPALHGGYLDQAGAHWNVIYTRPKDDPLGNLMTDISEAMSEEAGLAVEDVWNELKNPVLKFEHDYLPLIELFKTYRRQLKKRSKGQKSAGNLLIVVDQFEELFPRNPAEEQQEKEDYPGCRIGGQTYAVPFQKKEAAKRQFVDLLLGVLRQWKEPVYVCITMRSDFVGETARYSGLPALLSSDGSMDLEKRQAEKERIHVRKALQDSGCEGLSEAIPGSNYVELPEAVNDGLFLVSRMNPTEICEAIQGPLKVTGGAIEKNLLAELVIAADDKPDNLPVLQHALRRTWEHSKPVERDVSYNTTLTEQDYIDIGRMDDALDVHASEVLEALEGEVTHSEYIARRIFQALTGYTIDGRPIRRRVTLPLLEHLVRIRGKKGTLGHVISLFRGNTLDASESLSEGAVEDVVNKFASEECSLLMTSHVPDEKGRPNMEVEISHESLMHGWARLGEWMGAEGADGQLFNDMSRRSQDPTSARLDGGDFKKAKELREKTGFDEQWASRYLHIGSTDQKKQSESAGESQEKTANKEPVVDLKEIYRKTLQFFNESVSFQKWKKIRLGSIPVLAVLLLGVYYLYNQAEEQKQESWIRGSALASSYHALRTYNLHDWDLSMQLARAGYMLNAYNSPVIEDNVHEALRTVYSRSLIDPEINDYLGELKPNPAPQFMDGAVRAVAWSKTGRIALGDETGRLIMMTEPESTPASDIQLFDGIIRDMTWDVTGTRLVSAGQVCTSLYRSTCSPEELERPGRIVTIEDDTFIYEDVEYPVFSLALHPQGSLLATAGRAPKIETWRASGSSWSRDTSLTLDLPPTAALEGLLGASRVDSNWVNAVEIAQIGERSLLAAGSQDGKIRLWLDWDKAPKSAADLELIPSVEEAGNANNASSEANEERAPINALAFSNVFGKECDAATGDKCEIWLVSGGEDFAVRLWHIYFGSDVRPHTELFPVAKEKQFSAFKLAVSRDLVLPGTDAVINTVAFSELSDDGEISVAAGDGGFNRAIMKWDLKPLMTELTGSRASAKDVFGCLTSPVDCFSDSREKKDLVDQPLIYRGHQGWVHSLAFNPSGNRFVSGGNDYSALVWDADPDTLATSLCTAIQKMSPENVDLIENDFETYVSKNLDYDDFKSIVGCQ